MDDGHLILDASREWSDPTCPVCDEPFDADEWQDFSVASDEFGGVATHQCPNDDCDGSIAVVF